MKERLEEIGKRLGLSENDIKKVRKEGKKYRTLFFLGGAILALISFILGLLFGWFTRKETGGNGSGNPDPGGGYPYAGVAVVVGGLKYARPSRMALILAAAVAFLAGLSAPVFGQSIDYGVFNRS